ncbi:MAG: shikimate kinase [Pseudomonadota bacterium]
MPDHERIFLIGPMGAGKSAVGRSVASQLDFDFADTDSEVERNAGVDIPFIFEKEGEPGFRLREHRALSALCNRSRVVVATGGGCVTTPANRDLLERNGTVIYLMASIDQLFERVRCSHHRPLLQTDDPRSALELIVASRRDLYESVADVTVDTEGQRVMQVARGIARQLVT